MVDRLKKCYGKWIGDDPRDEICCVECNTWVPYVGSTHSGDGWRCKACTEISDKKFQAEWEARQRYIKGEAERKAKAKLMAEAELDAYGPKHWDES